MHLYLVVTFAPSKTVTFAIVERLLKEDRKKKKKKKKKKKGRARARLRGVGRSRALEMTTMYEGRVGQLNQLLRDADVAASSGTLDPVATGLGGRVTSPLGISHANVNVVGASTPSDAFGGRAGAGVGRTTAAGMGGYGTTPKIGVPNSRMSPVGTGSSPIYRCCQAILSFLEDQYAQTDQLRLFMESSLPLILKNVFGFHQGDVSNGWLHAVSKGGMEKEFKCVRVLSLSPRSPDRVRAFAVAVSCSSFPATSLRTRY